MPYTDFKMKINKYMLQQRQQHWNSNKHNKLLKIKPALREGKQSYRKKTKKRRLYCPDFVYVIQGQHILTYLKWSSNQCHTCQTKYTVKHILIECTDLARIRETFYSANDMKELFQNIEMKNIMSFLKAINIHSKYLKEFSTRPNFSYKLFLKKKYFNKIWSFPQTVPKNKKEKILFLHDDSLQINFEKNLIFF